MSKEKKTKSYRVKSYIKLIITAIDNVVGKNKTFLLYSMAYNRKLYDYQVIKSLPSLNKNEIFKLVITNYRQYNNGITLHIDENDTRIQEFFTLLKTKNIEKDRKQTTYIILRMDQDLAEILDAKPKEAKEPGEKFYASKILEHMILDYLIHMDDSTYELVKDVYRYILEENNYYEILKKKNSIN